MIIFVIGILVVIAGIAYMVAAFASEKPKAAGVGIMILGLVFTFISCLYSQDVGEVIVLRSIGGSIAGHTTEAGFHFTAPWNETITFDTRNNLINFYASEKYEYDGGSATGPDVTINDKSGAKADIDIQVNYSLNPDYAEHLYSEYGTQENFTQNYISNDLRSVAREVSGRFDTITMLTDRSKYTNAVEKALMKKWKKNGLVVEQVSVQDVRYPSSVTNAYTEAQAAEVKKKKAQNEQESAKIEADTKVMQAQKEAEANAAISNSLTDSLLQQQYIDALKEMAKGGNTILIPEGTTPIVTTK